MDLSVSHPSLPSLVWLRDVEGAEMSRQAKRRKEWQQGVKARGDARIFLHILPLGAGPYRPWGAVAAQSPPPPFTDTR